MLGDRTRLRTDPEDQDIFVRSMAARDQLGGLAEITFAAMALMRALYDVVLIETVGVGQSGDRTSHLLPIQLSFAFSRALETRCNS